MCKLDLIIVTTWPGFTHVKNVSLSEIHQSLLYGLDLNFCSSCRITTTAWEKFIYNLLGPTRYLLIPLAILVFIIAGVSLPVTIIIGIAGVLVLSFISYFQGIQDRKYLLFHFSFCQALNLLFVFLGVACRLCAYLYRMFYSQAMGEDHYHEFNGLWEFWFSTIFQLTLLSLSP
ncbi:uncharacterized protein LOC125209454 isoform X1 [Salvia hispanica]|uniref:uncharacterized protein LOC125209454 isoform X1 n=1 Tax=Salvia hispanica TaxID=49212 RepID=UPI002009D01D|nr:uncharacterized protein LOC125209454 isoform X1 [Salvia hispanica]